LAIDGLMLRMHGCIRATDLGFFVYKEYPRLWTETSSTLLL